MRYGSLFEPVKVGAATLKNRLVMPPMCNNLANVDGTLSPASIAYYTERARGGVGLIVVEASAVDFPHGLILERQLRVDNKNVMPEWRRLAESVHAFGTKIIDQIHHGGFLANPEYNRGEVCLSPSGYDGDLWFPARAMTHDEVKEIIAKHVSAAEMLAEAGLDGVEVHCSSTYLVNEFLTPEYNHRTDEYGGSLENRARILTDIISGIRQSCPPDFIISVRLAIQDREIPNGLSLEDGVAIAKLCEAAGADMINCTVGFFQSQFFDTESPWQHEGGRLYMAEAVKKEMTTAKVAAVGKFRTPAFMEEVIEQGDADLICIGRQLVCDPFFPRKVERGAEDEVRPCLSCNDGCVDEALIRHGSMRCAINPFAGREFICGEHDVPLAGIPKRVTVVGGGLAGMQAAIIASKRGHDVTILEASDRLGGQMIAAGAMPIKEAVGRALGWFTDEVARLGIRTCLNAGADLKAVLATYPDAVILATGSDEVRPASISGIENAVSSWELLSRVAVEDAELFAEDATFPGSHEEGPSWKDIPRANKHDDERAIVIGGGAVGCEVAYVLDRLGYSVMVLEMTDELCAGEEPMQKDLILAYLDGEANMVTGVTVTSISGHTVNFESPEGHASVDADLIVNACGSRPSSAGDKLYKALLGEGVKVYRVGAGGIAPGQACTFRSATRSAMDAALLA